MWDLPGPGLEPVSPALAGGFLTTEPPGKPYYYYFACGCPVILAPFLEEIIFAPLYCLSSFVKE